MGKLDGKVAVITGGSAGMGLATAKLFVREGAAVVITGRNRGTLDAAVGEIGGDMDGFVGDVSSVADQEALATHVEHRHGRVDIVFANAGVGRLGTMEQVSEADFDFVADINLKGVFFTAQKLVPLMTSGGSIILNSSSLSAKGQAAFSVYAATKAAVRSLARSLAAELSGKGIRVNALAPGHTSTDFLRTAGLPGDMIEQVDAQAHVQIPMHRSGTPDEMARAALFLASNESSYVTGIELSVDGGSGQV